MSDLNVQVQNVANGIEFLEKVVYDYGELPSRDDFEDDVDVWEQLIDLIPSMEERPDYPDVWFGYSEDLLDVLFESRHSIWDDGFEVLPTKLRYVVTTGGPHVEIVANLLTKRLVVEGYWGTEKCVQGVVSEGLYTHMEHYAEMMADTLNSHRASR